MTGRGGKRGLILAFPALELGSSPPGHRRILLTGNISVIDRKGPFVLSTKRGTFLLSAEREDFCYLLKGNMSVIY